MTDAATRGFTVATDVADALIERGVTARSAHRLVGEAVAAAKEEALGPADLASSRAKSGVADLHAPLDAAASIAAKRTLGSTETSAVAQAMAATRSELTQIQAEIA